MIKSWAAAALTSCGPNEAAAAAASTANVCVCVCSRIFCTFLSSSHSPMVCCSACAHAEEKPVSLSMCRLAHACIFIMLAVHRMRICLYLPSK